MGAMEALLELSIWPIIVVSGTFYFVCLAVYRITVHPLAGFPGPKLAAVSKLYEGYYDVILQGQYTWKIEQMHKKHGTYDPTISWLVASETELGRGADRLTSPRQAPSSA